uniref:myelin-associated glycoprotein-like n=1 Tax=Epinephelus lanceolatus TaxID=310571 RepID=UPI001446B8C1|nr:myelin-associated glycoprotein-like [Epinephelus lanceolatus]
MATARAAYFELQTRSSETKGLRVRGQWRVTYAPTRVCATKGSTVDMHCTYTYPSTHTVDRAFWFTISDSVPLDSDSDYTGRVEYDCNENNCTLRITSLTGGDSAQYYFRFTTTPTNAYTGPAGVTLSVTDAPKLPSVSVSPSGDIMEGSSVNLTCSSDANIEANYTWYKNDTYLYTLSEEPQLVFSSIQSSDTGLYYCAAENELGRRTTEYFIDVKYAPKLPSVSVSPSGEIVEGRSVNLTCSSDANPAAYYTWYKNNQTLLQGPEVIYQFSSISSEDRGIYHCKSENQYGEINSSSLYLDVQYAPKLPSVSVSPSAEIVEGSTVNLICISDANPAATYTWYKNDTYLYTLSEVLVFSSIQSSDTGLYYCAAENKLGRRTTEYFIDVKYAPKLPSVSVSPSGEIVEGRSVNLTCSSDANPAAQYTWYKNNQTLLQGPEDIYQFSSISSEDRGIYHCKSENQYGEINSSSLYLDVQYAPKLPAVAVSPSAEIVEGSTVNLICSSDANPAATYTWYKENEDSPKASGQIFTIIDLRAEHSGNYYCEAQSSRGRHRFTIHLTVVADSYFTEECKLIMAGTLSALSVCGIFIFVLLCIRKKGASKQPAQPPGKPDNSAQKQPAEQEDNIHYARISFLKKQADPLYSNTIPAHLQIRKREKVDSVEYSTVKFNSGSKAPGSAAP